MHRLQNDSDLNAAISVIDALLDREHLTAGEQEYLAALGLLVEAYESEHVLLPDVSGIDVLRSLMEENGLRQIDLVDIFGAKSIVSETLSGKRRLTVGHIQALSARFRLPADVFIDATP